MHAEPSTPLAFDASILAQLACPACHGDLRLDGARILCTACHCTYPIVDGIPVLIGEGAVQADQKS